MGCREKYQNKLQEELYACFVNWQQAYYPVKWTKLMQILKKTGIDWQERGMISKLYTDQGAEV
jgi:hypothetical protein